LEGLLHSTNRTTLSSRSGVVQVAKKVDILAYQQLDSRFESCQWLDRLGQGSGPKLVRLISLRVPTLHATKVARAHPTKNPSRRLPHQKLPRSGMIMDDNT
jgi:hypothetical protein